jgi:hypothetical protein
MLCSKGEEMKTPERLRREAYKYMAEHDHPIPAKIISTTYWVKNQEIKKGDIINLQDFTVGINGIYEVTSVEPKDGEYQAATIKFKRNVKESK